MVKHTERAVPDSTQVKTQYANRSQAVVDLGLEHYVMQLEVDGLCVVPPEVHGVPISIFHDMVNFLLAKAEQLVVWTKVLMPKWPSNPASLARA